MDAWMSLEFLGNPVEAWFRALGIALVINLLVALARRLAITRLSALASRSQTRLDDALVTALQRTRQLLVFGVALLIGSRSLELTDRADLFIKGLATVSAFVQIGLWASSAVGFWLARTRERALASNAGAATGLAAMGFIAYTLLWTLITLLALDNLGINITALVAGLGIGGVAIALAVQNILGDLFASLSIVIDKPFVIGDFIVVDEYMGTVEYVGLKTTRVRSLGGEQIIFPNGDLLKARTRNYKRMIERRVAFAFGLDCRTDPDRLAEVPKMLQRIITSQKGVRFERAHLQKFGASSLDYEVVYWMLDDDFNRYMDTQQAISIELIRVLGAAGIVFALPTRLMLVEGPLSVNAAVSTQDQDKAPARPRPAFDGPEVEMARTRSS